MTYMTTKCDVVISNPEGLHARPATLFAQTASKFKSTVRVSKSDQEVDGKSILDILTLAATPGSKLTIEATGEDAEEAIDALRGLVARRFRES